VRELSSIRVDDIRRMTGAGGTVPERDASREEMSLPIRERLAAWLRSREGVLSLVVGTCVSALLLVSQFGGVPSLLAGAGVGWGVISLAGRLWNLSTAPEPPAFSTIRPAGEEGLGLLRDDNAGFWTDTRGFLGDRRVWFAGTGCVPRRFTPDEYVRLRMCHNQGEWPVLVARSGESQWWWWHSAFYRDSADFDPIDVEALLLMADDGAEQG
jgi:hypothetical protein